MATNKAKSKIRIIIAHEYISKIKTKGFIIGTIIAPIALLLLIAIPSLVTYFSMHAEESSDSKIAIIDNTGANISQKIIDSKPEKYITSNETEEELQKQILANELGGALILNKNSIIDGTAKILTSSEMGLKFVEDIKSKVNHFIKERRLQDANISQETINLVNSSIHFETIKITEEGIEKDNTELMSFLGYALGFVMYGLVLMYGAQVMQGVIEEKSNRVIEVLASSAKPFEIMFGKVIGIGAVGLTQVLFWIILASALLIGAGYIFGASSVVENSTASSQMMDPKMMQIMSNLDLPSISPWIFISFAVYFLLGYFLYATLFAAVGATVDQMQDANNISTPLSMLIIIPILFIPNIMVNPEGTLAIVLSLIPFFTPILMIARIASISVPIWQIVLSLILMLVTIFLSLKLGSKIYRIAMLRYGKKPTFKEFIEWVKM